MNIQGLGFTIVYLKGSGSVLFIALLLLFNSIYTQNNFVPSLQTACLPYR